MQAFHQSYSEQALQDGEFWFVDEDETKTDYPSPHQINGTAAILADIWEKNVAPGRRLRMALFDDSVRLSRAELDLIHKTWQSHVRPRIPIDNCTTSGL